MKQLMTKLFKQYPHLISRAPGQIHGGIHPAEHKTLSNHAAIDEIAFPAELVISLQQHIGKAASPVIQPGDHVVKKQLIAEASPLLGANIHSPANGRVKAIEERFCGHSSGLSEPAVVIQVDADQSVTPQPETGNQQPAHPPWQSYSTAQLRQKIAQAGIVGLGGATYPTLVKLSPPKEHQIGTLLVNAMECEPYISCDDRMLRELPLPVIEGAQIAAAILGAKKILFASEDNKPEAIASLASAIESSKYSAEMKIVVAPTKYPSGGEKQVIQLLLNKQVPQSQRPSAIGVVVLNISTLAAIYGAVVDDAPLTRRLVTVSGDLVEKPGNYWIPFGTPLSHIASVFNIEQKSCQQVILGGPMMGKPIRNYSVATSKSTNCVLFDSTFNAANSSPEEITQSCIRCADCASVCPAQLLPQQLYWFSKGEQWEAAEKQGLPDCIECGACAYVCPSHIPLVDYFRFAKSSIRQDKIKQANAEKAKRRFESKQQRLEQAKQERALKHKQAAAKRKAAADKAQVAKSQTVKTQAAKAQEEKTQPANDKQVAINQALERVRQKKLRQNQISKNIENLAKTDRPKANQVQEGSHE